MLFPSFAFLSNKVWSIIIMGLAWFPPTTTSFREESAPPFPNSSEVEQQTVNLLVGGSIPSLGANYFSFS